MSLSAEFHESLELARSLQTGRRMGLASSFSEEECVRLDAARRSVQIKQATVVYCVYENPFAKSGGIFAVADNYCSTLQAQGVKVVIVTPFHSRLRSAPDQSQAGQIGECRVGFGGDSIHVEIYEHLRDDVRWILLRAPGFFEADGGEGGLDPYVDSDPTRLLRDSLFLSAAVPEAVAAIGHTRDLVFHIQDWELAAAALTVKCALLDERLHSAIVVLTSHNPYDHRLPSDSLRLITHRDFGAPAADRSMCQSMMPLSDGPVTTVSRNFARELTSDPLQTQYFADHLQGVYASHGIIGVDNGLFGRPRQVYSDEALRDLASGAPARILDEKRAQRRTLLQVLNDYQDERIVGHLDGGDGRPLTELADEIPLFLMFGRMDPGQKGFDVLVRAIEAMPRGWGRFILTPIISGGDSEFRNDLFRTAASRPGEVVVYPFRMEQGYMEAMRGATYAVMPSLYEPFGGATEPYLAGTPVVARATGGLLQQVRDLESDESIATGILYREEIEGSGEEWRAVQAAPTPVARLQVRHYHAMVAALAAALVKAAEIYQSRPAVYASMLGRLLDHAQQFSWDRAQQEYAAVYQLAAE